MAPRQFTTSPEVRGYPDPMAGSAGLDRAGRSPRGFPPARLGNLLNRHPGDPVALGRFFGGYANCDLPTSPFRIEARFRY